jgi:uncharacterized membrane protein
MRYTFGLKRKMTTDIILLVLGLLLGLFIPGFLATRLLFRDERIGTVEAFTYSITSSLALDIVLGLFLGASRMQKELTGGITGPNIWTGLLAVSCFLCVALMIRKKR